MENEAIRWDEYVHAHPDSTFYHQIGWRTVLEDTYKHRSIYLIAETDDGKICGVMPLFIVRTISLKKSLVSLPFAPYGGACCDSDRIEKRLIDHAIMAGVRLKINSFEFRSIGENNNYSGFKNANAYSTFMLDLSSKPDLLWGNFDRDVKRKIKKGFENLTFTMDELDALPKFYGIYAKNMNRLGTPVHDYRFFQNICEKFQGNVHIALAYHNGIPVSSLFLLRFKDTLISGFGSSLTESLKYGPNNYIYWNSIQYACEKKLHNFDFGRSQVNTGNYQFKEGWGTRTVPLSYYTYPPNKTVKPPQDTYRNLSKIWSKMPLAFSIFLGPNIRKHIS
jgi:FemAB-related protein (PEP-CTERM system-associated)